MSADPHSPDKALEGNRTVPSRLRNSEETAEPRALVYAIFSKIMSSPFETKQDQLEAVFSEQSAEVLEEVQPKLPFDVELTVLAQRIREVADQNLESLPREYSSLFEVGNEGPVVPLRAELVRVNASKMKEEIVRFYDFFSYDLKDDISWSPDHIAVLLEFMQVLCMKEVAVDTDEERESFARAQLDFLDRHIVSWLPITISRLIEQKREGFYTHVMTKLWEFLEQDRIWNDETVPRVEEEA